MRHLKIPEAAKRFRVHPITVRRWIFSGRLPATKPGATWLIAESDIEALLDSGRPALSTVDEYINALVDRAPDFTSEQISKLRQILAR